MEAALPVELGWWITAVEIPILTALFWLILRGRKETDTAMHDVVSRSDNGDHALREALTAYKLEVAKTYATLVSVKEIERQMIHHLVRIEAKLDAAAFRPRTHHEEVA